MCGILCCFEAIKQNCNNISHGNTTISDTNRKLNAIFSSLKSETINRGPDYVSPVIDLSLDVSCSTSGNHRVEAHFLSTVLSLRSPFTKQPIVQLPGEQPTQGCSECVRKDSLIIQFNGELYNDCIEGNDTAYFASGIEAALFPSEKIEDNESRETRVAKFLNTLRGEYAFVVTDTKRNEVWFARDIIGRRSLVMHRQIRLSRRPTEESSETQSSLEENEDDSVLNVEIEGELESGVVISSVAGGPNPLGDKSKDTEDCVSNIDIETMEIPSGKLFKMDLNCFKIESFQWTFPDESDGGSHLKYPYNLVNRIRLSDDLLFTETPEYAIKYQEITDELDEILLRATKRRIADVPHIVHKKPISEDDSTGSGTKTATNPQFVDLSPGAPRIAILFSGGIDCSLLAHYVSKVMKDVNTQGYKEPIDLLNVAFENPRKAETKRKEQQSKSKVEKKNKKNKAQKTEEEEPNSSISKESCPSPAPTKHIFEFDERYETPDRTLGRKSWDSLSDCYPNLRFVEINIPYEETLSHKQRVCDLMHPRSSVMDLSIAIAFYFASRGRGTMYSKHLQTSQIEKTENYETTANVLLSGLGADELFGGYMRHARIIENGIKNSSVQSESHDIVLDPFEELAQELQTDFSRLHYRNLGRDDRVCSTWARELRYIYLDEEVVEWAMGVCPLDMKIHASKNSDPLVIETNNEPVNDIQNTIIMNPKRTKNKKVPKVPKADPVITKFVLRCLAKKYSQEGGLGVVEHEKKRAIQFGARSAKMEIGSGRSRGTDRL